MKHTQGEWIAEPKHSDLGTEKPRYFIGIKGGRIIGTIQAENGLANARLITAAPDLLDVCKDFVEMAKWDKKEFAYIVSDFCHSRIKKAIAKAEPESEVVKQC